MNLTQMTFISTKGWQEYTEELYKKDLHNQDNHDGVITLWSQVGLREHHYEQS